MYLYIYIYIFIYHHSHTSKWGYSINDNALVKDGLLMRCR